MARPTATGDGVDGGKRADTIRGEGVPIQTMFMIESLSHGNMAFYNSLRNLFRYENHGNKLNSTGSIMIVYDTNFSLQPLPPFEFGVCLREKLSAAAFSAAGIELYCFSFSFHVS
ncbi:hypothetical protein Dsin_016992 [Dipteronia sinensis]|uniref:Uncharacterized protein n=1 Tax=Dipteronia sinensis TaxID=43782 RepID=A0AAE0E607_9ROSI|nr:hypothetical protein Dsin_016992 [Dipteronia sinensis]